MAKKTTKSKEPKEAKKIMLDIEKPKFEPYHTEVQGVPVWVQSESLDANGRIVMHAADGCTYHK